MHYIRGLNGNITCEDKSSSFNELLEKDNFQSIIKTCKLEQRCSKCTNCPIICLLQFSTIFLHQELPFITCLTQLVLKCDKSVRSTMVLKLYPIQDQELGAQHHSLYHLVVLNKKSLDQQDSFENVYVHKFSSYFFCYHTYF